MAVGCWLVLPELRAGQSYFGERKLKRGWLAGSLLSPSVRPLLPSCVGTHSCPTLCDSMDCSPPGSSVHRTLQERVLERVAISSSRGSSQPKDLTRVSCVSCIGKRILSHWAIRKTPILYLVLAKRLRLTHLSKINFSTRLLKRICRLVRDTDT